MACITPDIIDDVRVGSIVIDTYTASNSPRRQSFAICISYHHLFPHYCVKLAEMTESSISFMRLHSEPLMH